MMLAVMMQAFQTGSQNTARAGNARTPEADTAMDGVKHEASQSALPEAAHAASDDEAAKERDKHSAPGAMGAPSLSFTDPIPTEKLRMAAASALSAAAVSHPTSCLGNRRPRLSVEARTGAGHGCQAIGV